MEFAEKNPGQWAFLKPDAQPGDMPAAKHVRVSEDVATPGVGAEVVPEAVEVEITVVHEDPALRDAIGAVSEAIVAMAPGVQSAVDME